MNIDEMKTVICDLRCKMEELADEWNQYWVEAEKETEECLAYTIRDILQDCADQLSEWED